MYQVELKIETLELPEAEDGTGTLRYSLSLRLPDGLAFSDQERTITGTPRAPIQTTIYTLTATDRANRSATFSFTLTVFNIRFHSTIYEGGNDKMSRNLERQRWNVWNTATIRVTVGLQRTADGYTYRLTIPTAGGFEEGNSCGWSAERINSDWFDKSTDTLLTVTKCGIGQENATYSVSVRVENEEAVLYVGNLYQARHVGDEVLTYRVAGSTKLSFFGSARPVRLPDQPDSEAELLKASNYGDGLAWNRAGVTVRAQTASGADVRVRGYWTSNSRCEDSIACLSWSGSPHLASGSEMRMWFEQPPRWEPGPYKEWTTDIDTYRSNPDYYEYLPALVMHEFGHAIGLAHGGAGIMVGPHDDLNISTDDQDAAESIYQPHAAH